MNVDELQEKCLKLEKEIWDKVFEENSNVEPIIDGIVNIGNYANSKVKILWILKEPYDDVSQTGSPEGGGWHFANDFLTQDDFYERMGESRATWQPIIYSTYGILNGFQKWNDMDYIRDDIDMVKVVQNIAVINVKKLPGLTTTPNFQSIEDAYNKYKDILLKQIETYNPDLIIGGSTLPLFYKDLGVDESMINKNDYGSIHFVKTSNRLLISAYHPAQRTIARENYINDIVDIADKHFNSNSHSL